MDELTAIPGIGDRTAGDLVVNRPYDSISDAQTAANAELDLSRFATISVPTVE